MRLDSFWYGIWITYYSHEDCLVYLMIFYQKSAFSKNLERRKTAQVRICKKKLSL